MRGYSQRRSSLIASQGQEYDYNSSHFDGRGPYGPPSSVKPQSLPSRPVDPQGEHGVPRKHSESFSSIGIKATNIASSASTMSDLEKLRALKKAIMDGQVPGYDATPKPQALEALYSPRADFTGRTNDPATDTSYQRETGYSLDNQSTTRSLDEIPRPIVPPTSTLQNIDTTATVPSQNQEMSGSNQVASDVARSPTIDRPAATLPLTDNHAQSVTIPRAADETQTASPTSMIMSPTEPRLVHQSSITDMEIDSPPPSTGPPPIQEVNQSNSAPPPIESIQRDQDKSGPPEPKPDKQSDAPPALGIPHPEQRPESGSPVAPEPSRGRYTYSDEPRRQEDSRYVDYRSRPSYAGNRRSESGEIERTGLRSPELNSQRGYRRASSPDAGHGLSGPARPSNDVRRYHYYESGPRFPSNRSPPRSSFSESRGYDSGSMDGGRVMPREPYPGPPGDRSSAPSRNFPYDREPSRFGGTIDERRQSTLPESSDGRPLNQNSPQRRVPETQRTQPPVNPSPPTTGSLSGAPQSRASDGGRYFYPPQSSLPPGAGRSIPLESNTGIMNVKAEAPDDGDSDRRSATPRSVGEPGAPRSSSFIPGRVPDGLPSRPPPSVDEPLTPRSSLMPDRIAPDSRQYVPLAARLTSPNDYAQRGQRSGPPMRGPPVDARRPVDELRYSSPTDRDSWNQSGRTDEPLRRESNYPRPDDARDYSRVVPRADWERSRSPQGDRYGPPMSSRPPVPPAGYPYGRDRSLSPPRRSGTYPRSGYPDVDDNRGTKRPRQELIDPDYRRPPPPDWRPRDEYDPRAPPPPPRQPYVDPRGPYTRPPPPDAYRSYDREPYPPDNRPRPPPLPYGNDRDRYPPDAEWSGRPPYRR